MVASFPPDVPGLQRASYCSDYWQESAATAGGPDLHNSHGAVLCQWCSSCARSATSARLEAWVQRKRGICVVIAPAADGRRPGNDVSSNHPHRPASRATGHRPSTAHRQSTIACRPSPRTIDHRPSPAAPRHGPSTIPGPGTACPMVWYCDFLYRTRSLQRDFN